MSFSPFSNPSIDEENLNLTQMLESIDGYNGEESSTKPVVIKTEESQEGSITPVLSELKTFSEVNFSQYFLDDPLPLKTEEESIFSQDNAIFAYHQFDSDDQQSAPMTTNSKFDFETVNHSQQRQSASTERNTSASGQMEHHQEVIQVKVQDPHMMYGTIVQIGNQQVFVPKVINTETGQVLAGLLLPPSMGSISFQPNQVFCSKYFFMHTPVPCITERSTAEVKKSSPASTPTRRSKRRSVSSTATTSDASAEDGGLVLPEAEAQGTYTLNGEKIRRPPNAFMIFAKSRRREILYNSNSQLSNKDVSMQLGIEWNTLSEEERNKYRVTANELRHEHQIKFPGKF